MFQLTEPQKMIQQMMRMYVTKEIQPHVEAMEDGKMSWVDLGRKMYKTMGGEAMIKPALEKLAKKREEGGESQTDLTKLMAGDEGDDMGGMGGDPMIMFIMVKELSRVSPGLAMSFGVSAGLAGGAVVGKGTARQIREYGIPLMTLQKIGAWCLTEPGAGSDAFGSMKSKAKPDGSGGYIINGTKTFITNGPVADFFVVYAKLELGSETPVHTFILERGMKGLSTGTPFHKMGMKDSPTSEVFMEDVKLEKKHLLGESESKGGRQATKESLGNERSGVPAMCWGIIERCYEESVKYAKERVQFGKPIAEFQATQLKIYRMYMHLKNIENMVIRMAWMQKKGIRDASYVNGCKAYSSQAAVEVANEALQIFGGYGYMREYPIEKMYRDAKLLELGAGTTDINMLTCARSELGLLK
ncbi:MAG TPA: acyl-CoA dehydrogenase family protein [bacterium]|nr:acyl-CoA dehydrogenase family protein [bacterium]